MFRHFGLSVALLHAASICAARSFHVPIVQQAAWPEDAALTRRATSKDVNVTSGSFQLHYYTQMSIGTPYVRTTQRRVTTIRSLNRSAQNFKMIVDFLSADVMVAVEACNDGCPKTAPLYDPRESSTAANTTITDIAVQYRAASITGDIVSDTVRLGTYSVTAQLIVALLQMPPDLLPNPVSGILGLGLAGLQQKGESTSPFWQSVVQQGGTNEIGVWLARSGSSASNESAPGGEMTMGGVNPALYSGDIEYRNVTGAAVTFWTLAVSSVTVQGKSISSIDSSSNSAGFDTKQTNIGGPSGDVTTIWAAVPDASTPDSLPSGFYQFPCTTKVNIGISFGGRTWPISAEDMNLGPVEDGSSLCLGALYASSDDSWTFGRPFLNNVYMVLRQTPPAVGFAELSTVAGGTGIPAASQSASGSSTSSAATSSSTSSGVPGSSNPPPTSFKKKSNAPAIAGGVVGGLLVILGAFAFLFYRRRSRTDRHTGSPGTALHAGVPLPFIVYDEKLEPGDSDTTVSPILGSTWTPELDRIPLAVAPVQSSSIGAPSSPQIQSPSTTIAELKRAQAAAVQPYDDLHIAPDSVTQTDAGIHLAPGRPHGAQASRILTPTASATAPPDPEVLQELQYLRGEVQRLVSEAGPPPSYDEHGNLE